MKKKIISYLLVGAMTLSVWSFGDRIGAEHVAYAKAEPGQTAAEPADAGTGAESDKDGAVTEPGENSAGGTGTGQPETRPDEPSGDAGEGGQAAEPTQPTQGNNDPTGGEEVPGKIRITAVKSLGSAANQKVTLDKVSKAVFPKTIKVRTEGADGYTDLAVKWNKPASMTEKVGTYTCTAQMTDAAKEKYEMAEGVKLPSIKVTVSKAKTAVSGICKSYTRKSRGTIYDKVTVTNPYGRTLRLQRYTGKSWVTEKTYKLGTGKTAAVKVIYSNDWWKVPTSKWRMVLLENSKAGAYTGPAATVHTKRYYQNPSRYIQIQDKIKLKRSGGYTLSTGFMGFKVRKVNRYFHMGNSNWPRYTSSTKSRVRSFQARHGLKATGRVDKATWLKMGFSEWSWYNLGAYVHPSKVNPSSTKSQHIEAMISTAKEYLGSPYVVGGSGTASQGADCSGLVMQALYGAGVSPEPISAVRHSHPGYEYESRNMFSYSKFKAVPYSSKKRGDLIFYKGSSGAVNHVAIYLGGGKVIESWPNRIVIAGVYAFSHNRIAGVRRVFV